MRSSSASSRTSLQESPEPTRRHTLLQDALESRPPRLADCRRILSQPDGVQWLEKVDMAGLYAQQDVHCFLADDALRTALAFGSPAAARAGIASFLGVLSPLLHALALERDGVRDVFVWAALSGHDELLAILWPLCTDPLHVALLGSYACRLQAVRVAQGAAVVEERSRRLERWAVDALENAPDAAIAARAMTARARSAQLGSLLDFGLTCGMQQLLATRHARDLTEVRWRGGRLAVGGGGGDDGGGRGLETEKARRRLGGKALSGRTIGVSAGLNPANASLDRCVHKSPSPDSNP